MQREEIGRFFIGAEEGVWPAFADGKNALLKQRVNV